MALRPLRAGGDMFQPGVFQLGLVQALSHVARVGPACRLISYLNPFTESKDMEHQLQ